MTAQPKRKRRASQQPRVTLSTKVDSPLIERVDALLYELRRRNPEVYHTRSMVLETALKDYLARMEKELELQQELPFAADGGSSTTSS